MAFRMMILMAALALAFNTAGCGTTDADPTPDAGDETDAGDKTDAGDAGDETDEGDGGDEEEEPKGPEPCEPEDDPDGLGVACEGSTQGSCNPGKRYCETDGFWSACEGRRVPLPKLCDAFSCAGGLNDGCECMIGEMRSCYEGPDNTSGVGTCRDGFQTCEATADGSGWSDCRHQILPQADDCSGRNLNCVVADPNNPSTTDCSCAAGQTRACGGVQTGTCVLGTQSCDGGKWGACVDALQPIDGEEALCDARTCAGGMNGGCGECVIGETESCYTGAVGTEGVGSCKAGTRTCEGNNKWGPCEDQLRPMPNCEESCAGTVHPACL